MGVTAKINDKVYVAFENLKDDHNFNTIMEWLEQTKKKSEERLLWANNDEDRALWQGRTQMITEIVEERDDALEKLRKLKQKNPQK